MDFQEAIEKQIRYYEKECLQPRANAEGNAFEDLCKFYLENGPWGKENKAHVWKWGDPQNPLTLNAKNDRDRSSQDRGCDLVVQAADGSRYMVQCKYYPKSTLTLDGSHLANIYAIADRYRGPKDDIAFCYVADSISPSAQDVLKSHTHFNREAFESFDWDPMFGKKKKSKELRDYQTEAVEACIKGFKTEEEEGKRQVGKLIMACGTGKTFTAFALARSLSGGNPYTVLFLAPSIALVSQTFQAWGSEGNISSLIVCSDSRADKVKKSEEEIDEPVTEIPSFGVTTNADEMEEKWRKAEGSSQNLRVIFSTYQSIEAVKEFQEKTGVKFDLTICDEAHHTATHEDSVYAKAAEPGYIDTVKKLFMTATPKVYKFDPNQKSDEEYAETLYSMDDKSKFGPEFYNYDFGRAVREKRLCDYRVLVLAMKKNSVSLERIQSLISNTDIAQNELKRLEQAIRDAVEESEKERAEAEKEEYIRKLSTLAGKIQGSYIDLSDLEASNQEEVSRSYGGKIQLKIVGDGSDLESDKGKSFANSAVGFANTINTSKLISRTFERFNEEILRGEEEEFEGPKIEARHVDGQMPSDERLRDLYWLKNGKKEDEIRLLTNAQCLSEGVDVPSLDAVVFFEKRSSKIGIIQAIGRVMRKAPGKEFGYIILPVMVNDLENPEHELATNEEFGVIWEVLQTMRSIDEGLNAKINTLDYVKKVKEEEEEGQEAEAEENPQEPESFDEGFQKAFVSVSVSKLKNSLYWKKWADNISGSVQKMIKEIGELSETPEIKPKFDVFLENLANTIHKKQTKEDAVNLIAQFIVTRPVFSILFPASDFNSNPISRALEGIADDFKKASLTYEEGFSEALKADMQASTNEMAKSPAAKKELVKDFYEAFYQKVFPKEAKTNGIVYTPVPVVDFMIKETDRLLERNFGKRLQDEGIQILDPFSGTGTFVTRLLDKDLGVIDDEHVTEKYEKEIWSNEIMPTAYYISTLNIEDTMNQRVKEALPFPGGVLTDTFRISEAKGMLDASLFAGNSDRENKEEEEKIWAIISNPPYSVGAASANEHNSHGHYEKLDKRIETTYATEVNSTLKKSLYDSYARAFRWASDRVGEKGIVAFITNAMWLRSNAGAGIRRRFLKEFNDIYVYDLRGNSRLHDPKEGGNIFDIQTPVAITFLVKNPESDHKGQIHYISTPDFASANKKLRLLEGAVKLEPEWESLQMNKFGDWLEQRDTTFYSLLPMGITKNKSEINSGIFNIWSAGLVTGRNVWLYSFSKGDLLENVETFEDFFNKELKRWEESGKKGKISDFVEYNPTQIKWGEGLFNLLDKTSPLEVDASRIRIALFRPFTKKYLYFYKPLITRTYQQLHLFPENNSSNFEICVAGVGANKFSCLMTDVLPDFDSISKTQCFPLYRYEEDGFGIEEYERRSAITDQALKMFREVYGSALNSDPDKAKEQIFYYVYGMLHSKEYREKYQDTLSKDLPRIPFSSHFKEFEKAGRELAAFHVGYEEAPKCEDVLQVGEPEGEISKMRLNKDRGVLTVNRYLSFTNIPREAFEYVVNGRSPLDWIVNQYQITVDKDTPKAKGSQIVSNPNDSSISDIDYVSDLIPRLVTVSVKTQEIVNSLPSIDRITSMDSEIEEIWGINYTAEGDVKN